MDNFQEVRTAIYKPPLNLAPLPLLSQKVLHKCNLWNSQSLLDLEKEYCLVQRCWPDRHKGNKKIFPNLTRRFVSIQKLLHVENKAEKSTYLLLQKTDKPWSYLDDGKTLKWNKTIEITSIH